MELIFDEIFRALGYLFIAGIVAFAWKGGFDFAKGGRMKTVLWKGFFICVGIAFFGAASAGSPSCEEQTDPIYGGCDYYADDGYQLTTDAQTAKFAYYMTLLYIPVVIGAYSGNNYPRND